MRQQRPEPPLPKRGRNGAVKDNDSRMSGDLIVTMKGRVLLKPTERRIESEDTPIKPVKRRKVADVRKLTGVR